MKSTKNRKKGLLSIVSLIVCLAMLTVGTFAWFTDTATVSGNQVMAGNLDVAIVMNKKEIIEKVTGLEVVADDASGSDIWDGIDSPADTVTKVNLSAGWAAVTDPDSTSPFAGNVFTALKNVDAVKTGSDTLGKDTWYDVTGLKANKVRLGNLEPGAVYPVELDVYNRGELAIGFTASFGLPTRLNPDGTPDTTGKKTTTTYTGLEALGLQANGKLGEFVAEKYGTEYFGGGFKYSSSSPVADTDGVEFSRRADKLAKKMLSDSDYKAVKKDASTWNAFLTNVKSSYSTIKTKDQGKTLESVLEVYAISMDEYSDLYDSTTGWDPDTSKIITEKTPAKRYQDDHELIEPEKMNEHLLGTVEEFLHVNDSDTQLATYKAEINTQITAAETAMNNRRTELADAGKTPLEINDDAKYLELEKEYYKLKEKLTRVDNLKIKLAKSSSGYCVPTKALDGVDSINVELYTNSDGATVPGNVRDLGKAVFLIKMSEDADDLYQNAYIELDMGVTANQVKWDRDGVNNYLYDPNPDAIDAVPNPNPTPEYETRPEPVTEPETTPAP